MISAPLEDLKPYLDREELKKDMIIPLVDEK
jgi:acetolactate synthase-1/2/3 large subunit